MLKIQVIRNNAPKRTAKSTGTNNAMVPIVHQLNTGDENLKASLIRNSRNEIITAISNGLNRKVRSALLFIAIDCS